MCLKNKRLSAKLPLASHLPVDDVSSAAACRSQMPWFGGTPRLNIGTVVKRIKLHNELIANVI